MRRTRFLIRIFLVPLALAVGIAILLRLTVFQVFSIPSASMAPTLIAGDQILVTPYRLPFASDPARGDVVVFRSANGEAFVVKRVIAMPGDHVEIRQSHVKLNGRTLAEPYARSQYAIGEFGPDIIPAGSVFVLGDNRADSIDSRAFGPVARETIVGKVRCVLWSSDPERHLAGRGRPEGSYAASRIFHSFD
jgi:signal peptidase I